MAVAGVTMMSILAIIRPLPGAISLVLGVAAAVAVPWYFSAAALVASHPTDPFGIPPPLSWAVRLQGGEQPIDAALFALLGTVGFWLVGGWLAWCTLRWRNPLLGIFPAAAVFATDVLNSRDELNANTLYFLVLTIALLLRNNYQSSLLRALKSGLRMTSDSRWDFWETGLAATIGVMLLAIFLPPLTREDQTVNVENGVFRNWAEFQANLNHQPAMGRGGVAHLSTGFATEAGLGGPLTRSTREVLRYSIDGAYPGRHYLRGVNLQSGLQRDHWSYLSNPFGLQSFVAKNSDLPYLEGPLRGQGSAVVKVRMVRPPAAAPDVLFYPGTLDRTDRDTVAVESNKKTSSTGFQTVDRVSSQRPPSSAGQYRATVQYSNPTEDELRNAGTRYPDWLSPYRFYPGLIPAGVESPKNPGFQQQNALLIKGLADSVVAPFSNPYDKATAIETFLRANYTYRLDPALPKEAGQDPIVHFLLNSKEGYCEYFASAMGDMLRAERIPSRLVSGFGEGTYDSKRKEYIVRESDAHVWVEAYFPSYGWIPFEPTPDGVVYFPILRAPAPSSCPRDECSPGAVDTGDPAAATRRDRDLPGDFNEQGGNLGSTSQPGYWGLAPLLLLFVLGLLCIVVIRYLRPRNPAQTWRRLALLGRLAGVHGDRGDTPSEYGRRLAAAFPEAAKPLRELSDSFAITAYAPPEIAARMAPRVVERWREVRPHLVRRLVGRLRPAW